MNNRNTHATVGVELSKRIEHPLARAVKTQPPEIIHWVHLNSLARRIPTTVAGTIANPAMASKLTPDKVVDI